MGRPILFPVDSWSRLSGHGEEVKYLVGNRDKDGAVGLGVPQGLAECGLRGAQGRERKRDEVPNSIY